MNPNKPYEDVAEELQGIARSLRHMGPDSEQYEETASNLHDIYRAFLAGPGEPPELVDLLEEALDERILPVFRQELVSAVCELYAHRLPSDTVQSLTRETIARLRSELEQPLRQEVWSQREAIKQRLSAELDQEIRADLRAELADSIRDELRQSLHQGVKDELRSAVTEELRAELLRKLSI